jgi:hypothetical protein
MGDRTYAEIAAHVQAGTDITAELEQMIADGIVRVSRRGLPMLQVDANGVQLGSKVSGFVYGDEVNTLWQTR